MKKSFLFSFGLIAAFALLFVSCSDDNGGNNGVVSCTVSATATEGGIVTIENYSGNTAVLLAGNTVKFIATPNEGYQFVGWYINGSKTPVSTELIYSFIANKDVAYVAKFEKSFVVSLQKIGYGSVAFKDNQGDSLEFLIGSEVTVIAVPEENCDFVGWFVGNNDSPISTETTYTFTIDEDVALVAKFRTILIAVDLGLPSGLKWANYNVGAFFPEDCGGYYAWGEIEEKSSYGWHNYKWGDERIMTKYCTDSSYGTVDNKTVLDPEDDVAHVKFGGRWRMPTEPELEELVNGCDWEWTTINDIKGYRVTGPNGNSIFFPRYGHYYFSSLYPPLLLWSSSTREHDSRWAYGFKTNDGVWYDLYTSNRFLGGSVRAVCE